MVFGEEVDNCPALLNRLGAGKEVFTGIIGVYQPLVNSENFAMFRKVFQQSGLKF